MMRLFLAVDLPEALRVRVAAICQGVGGARWCAPEQLHLTLRFLGPTPEEQATRLQADLRPLRAPAFELALTGAGVFPPGGRRSARVLWLGVEPLEPLRALKAAIDERIGPDPESARRTFAPHLTLARFKEAPRADDLARFLDRHGSFRTEPFPVAELRLYQSTLRPTGAVYTPVAAFPLGG